MSNDLCITSWGLKFTSAGQYTGEILKEEKGVVHCRETVDGAVVEKEYTVTHLNSNSISNVKGYVPFLGTINGIIRLVIVYFEFKALNQNDSKEKERVYHSLYRGIAELIPFVGGGACLLVDATCAVASCVKGFFRSEAAARPAAA